MLKCAHEDYGFDRICPEPCGMMHNYCLACGAIGDRCYWDFNIGLFAVVVNRTSTRIADRAENINSSGPQ